MTDEQKGTINYQFTVPARTPWSRVIKKGELLTLVDMAGQQAVDFLCYDASDPSECIHQPSNMTFQPIFSIGQEAEVVSPNQYQPRPYSTGNEADQERATGTRISPCA